MTQSKFNKLHKLPTETSTANMAPMTEADVPKVTVALNRHLTDNYKVHIEFSQDEVRHFLLPREGVVHSWVIQDDVEGVTDFVSFYALNSSVLDDPHHDTIYAAYAYYNFAKGNDATRMKQLIKDALILAKNNNFDVYNMTEVLKHSLLRGDLFFKPGDGRLAHYLYNWRIQAVPSD